MNAFGSKANVEKCCICLTTHPPRGACCLQTQMQLISAADLLLWYAVLLIYDSYIQSTAELV